MTEATRKKYLRAKGVENDVIHIEDYIDELKAEGFTFNQILEIQARVACGQTLDSAMQSV